MTDPVLALILIVCFGCAAIVVRFFRTLDAGFWDAARNPLLAGVVAGALLSWAGLAAPMRAVAIGVVLTIAALYSRLTGDETEPVDGMLLGALSGAGASILLVITADEPLRAFAECVLAGAVAGFGITFAANHVADRVRQLIWDAVTAAVAVAAAMAPALAERAGVTDRGMAIAAATIVPLAVVAAVFRQWPLLREELRHEAALGFIAPEDVSRTANPILRLGRGGWTDTGAHREFVRLATEIALRKRQQKHRSEAMARLYQLEVIKLRMRLQNMTRIEHLSAARRHNDDRVPSDTMRTSE